MKQFIDFTDRVCVITGAGSAGGIGFACGKIFAELGAKVALIATTDRIRERAKELEALGGTSKGYVADLMDREQVQRVIHEILSDFGKIDILVNNAGLSQGGTKDKAQDFDEMPLNCFHRQCCKRAERCIPSDSRELYPLFGKRQSDLSELAGRYVRQKSAESKA